MKKKHIAVLITCHNRKQKTLNCLDNLYNQVSNNFFFDVYLTDDGSSDGTDLAVKEKFSDVNLFYGDGSFFWAGGTRNSWIKALESDVSYDYFLLLNDDTYMIDDSIDKLLESNLKMSKNGIQCITIGSTIDPETSKISYGGFKLVSKNKLKHYIIYDRNKEMPCDLGCANLMMVPTAIVKKIGVLDEVFIHGIADYDYTLRAKKAGFGVYVAPGYLGYCNNDHGRPWKGSHVSLKDRIKYLYSPKGLAFKEFVFFHKRHFPSEVRSIIFKLWLKTLLPIIYDNWKSDYPELNPSVVNLK